MPKQQETRGFSGDFHRHYHSNRDYFQEAKESSRKIRKKSRRITFINIFIIMIIFVGINFITKKNTHLVLSDIGNQDIFSYHLDAYMQQNNANISISIASIDESISLTPFTISFAWQNMHNTFARYHIVDDSLWDDQAEHYLIQHDEPALPGAILYVTIVKDNIEPLIIIKKIE